MSDTQKPQSFSAYNAGILEGKSYRVLQEYLTEALSGVSLSIPEWKLLGHLFDTKQAKVADLANFLSVDPPLITKLVISLEKKGFVKKNDHKTDKRITLIAITAKGSRVIPELEIVVKTKIRPLFSGITPEEFQTYIKVLMNIVKQGHVLSLTDSYLTE